MKKFIVTNSKLLSIFLIKLISLISIICFFSTANAKIISSVKPIAFITEAIASGVVDTDVLLPDGASPHTYSLKPSDLAKIKSADLVIWIGEDMEVFMPAVLKSVDEEKQIELITIPEINKLLHTDNEEHKHEDGDSNTHDHGHHHGDYDQHIWLSPEIAKVIAQSIHDKLITKYPTKKDLIDENLSKFILKITETEQNIAKKLINVQNKGYFVFHDAYGYFESQFGLKHLGSFTINPAVQPGVQKIYAVQKELKEHQAICIFREPQFNPAVIDKLVSGTDIRVGELDPLGIGITVSKEAYSQFLLNITQQLLDCLDK